MYFSIFLVKKNRKFCEIIMDLYKKVAHLKNISHGKVRTLTNNSAFMQKNRVFKDIIYKEILCFNN